ncbi:hypothetical protein [Yoonia sp. 2307UL14-13]|uniref:hypothetical protein n=1 Tax=Yoonia sp. 2307UL14-13 TaxID=3126506 RepID=UPI0030A572AD
MAKPFNYEKDFINGLIAIRALGAPVPDDTRAGHIFTHVDADGGNFREVGGWWLEHEDADRAKFITWLLPGDDIEEEALDSKERYCAMLVAIRLLIDEVTITRTGRVINTKASNDKLRAHRKRLLAKRRS